MCTSIFGRLSILSLDKISFLNNRKYINCYKFILIFIDKFFPRLSQETRDIDINILRICNREKRNNVSKWLISFARWKIQRESGVVSRLESSRTGWSRINRTGAKPMAVKGPRRTSIHGGWNAREARTEAVYMAVWLKAHPPSRIDRWL